MRQWTADEVELVTRAAERAPSVHNLRPWRLSFLPGRIELRERIEVVLPHHDPDGRDRSISCGAAVANIELFLRRLGMRTSLALLPDVNHPQLVARIHLVGHAVATTAERGQSAAIARRHSHRAPFSSQQIDAALIRQILQSAQVGVELYRIDGARELGPLAHLLGYAGSVHRGDVAYQRELAALTGALSLARPEHDTLPWAGLVRATTRLPDLPTLTERLSRELVALVLTPDDGRIDHVRAGIALQRTWLAAVADGLVASVHTQALQVREVRAGLIEQLGLAGYPQLIMRFGYPAEVAATESTATMTEAAR